MKVRNNLPVRRINPTNNPTDKKWSEHKGDLREDFFKHCGYCGSYDGFSHTYFEVDHFVPKSIFEKNNNISYCQYDNLVYSCKPCNNSKSYKWPSNDEKIHNLNDKGFIDPTNVDYDLQIYRTKNGSIRWLTDLGKWMVQIGFKFDERDYAIKLLWELNQLRKSIEFLTFESQKHAHNSIERTEILTKAQEFALEYVIFHQELMDYYHSR